VSTAASNRRRIAVGGAIVTAAALVALVAPLLA